MHDTQHAPTTAHSATHAAAQHNRSRNLLPHQRTGQALQRDVVHDLVVAALQESGVDGGEGHEALARQPRCKRDGVLLGDAHVEHAVGEALLKAVVSGKERKTGWAGALRGR